MDIEPLSPGFAAESRGVTLTMRMPSQQAAEQE
jgi:hypothetical protein